jgi:hypothetical protein
MDEMVFNGVAIPRPNNVGRGAWMRFWETIIELGHVLDEIEEYGDDT